jgi:signal transduction histidine kinase/CheY-like chemotaxis protein
MELPAGKQVSKVRRHSDVGIRQAGYSFMPLKGLGFSFRTILFATACIGILPTVVFAAYLLDQFAQSERARAEQLLTESTKGLARGIDAHFSATESALVALRDSDALNSDNLAAFELRLRRTAGTTGQHYALIDSSGQQLINTLLPEKAPLPKTHLGPWEAVFTEQRPIVTNVFEGLSGKNLLAGVAVPVVRDKKVKWALAASLVRDDFAGIINAPGVPEDWIVSIVDRTGTHMVRSHNNDKFAGKPLVPVLVRMMTARESGVVRAISLEGISLISNLQYAPKSGWAAAVGLPAKALDAPIRASLNQLMLIGMLVMAIALLLMFTVARLLDRAMQSLTRSALAIGRGTEVIAPPSGIKEVDDVGDVVTRTAHELNVLTSSRATRVAARTAELSTANRRLTAEMERRQQSEAQLMQMQKIEAIGHLTGGIAHDFNNMLAIILSSLRLLERRVRRGDFDVQRFVDAAIKGAERAASLTARLLAFSRQQPLAPEVTNGNELISTMGEILHRTIPENIRIETVLAGGLWRTFVDRPGLESVIINLAVNARDAMPDGGRLIIETANVDLEESYAAAHPDVNPGQYVMISVSDTGTGMSPEVVDRVFDPFFTTKPAGQGTGLGLSQVHGFIKQSGGHVAIQSEPGVGTTVKLYLPRHQGDGSPQTVQESRPPPVWRAPQGGETILVVEDEDAVRRLAVEMLSELGYSAVEAENAERALQVLEAHPEIDALITDIVMPGMNGRMLANEVLARRPGLPVLFTTGYTRDAIVHHGVLDPDVHVVMKPYSLELLSAKLHEVLSGRNPPFAT